MHGWQPIESAPKDGSLIVCWAAGWESPCFLRWKTNRRIQITPVSERGGLVPDYFGDSYESDDYELARPDGGPSHWHPLEAFPV